ncbi:2-keto-4-pentenoate hydratase/2-oxohepta-3-ene-1,7-dioic acid hydratase in catechol pathway [Xanthomonas campestris]|uniref:fumarylacetoacetate hydrolase family protein n=1 Tax=Xanthomonas sp. CFBP 8151 TaxID=3035310 RepID=UPI00141B7AF0|nr:fumarylacetoacetate hydrolase family protein [Xanthomonas campestris pv. campestris]NIJ75565.1 2-keto-4-pentenoate hydratase/2-oxohepta-3-ene-1,7-dioic acid hydratase in catechol pathway [Xanthomonas sp. CFBP 8151]
MRLISFGIEGRSSWGLWTERGVVDVGRRLPGCPTLRAALETGALAAARDLLRAGVVADYAADAVVLAPVVPDPGQVLCIGLNYEEHRAETRREPTGHPTVFARYPSSQVGHLGAMLLPPESTMFDYEGELAVVIGRDCRRVAEADALSVIAGYSCYNDGSIRDFQRHTTQFHAGKNWPATGAFGPWLVTPDEVPDLESLSIQTRLNGQVVQSGTLDQLIFTIPRLIAYCSTFTPLRAGDVIVTGTPGGIGAARTPPLWMKPGDRVEVEISGVGTLVNTVREEAVAASGERRQPVAAAVAGA